MLKAWLNVTYRIHHSIFSEILSFNSVHDVESANVIALGTIYDPGSYDCHNGND